MPMLRPDCDGDGNRQHGEPNDREAGNRKDKIAHESVQHLEMLAAQREAPLQPQQKEEQANQQRSSDIIH